MKEKNNDFFKFCSKCNKKQIYSSNKTLNRAIKNKTLCYGCSNKRDSKYDKKYCVDCEKEITRCNNITKRCKSCAAKEMMKYENKRKKISNKLKNRKFSNETKQKMRISAIKRIEERHGQIQPNYNSTACQILNEHAKASGSNIQHAENVGEFRVLGYFVDGYDKKNNIVYEYDEKRHFDINENLKEKDIVRQKEIEKHLNCKFIRIKEN